MWWWWWWWRVYRLARSMLTPSNGSRPSVPDILLIITDGQSDNPPETWTQAVEARRQGISVIAVCISAFTFNALVCCNRTPADGSCNWYWLTNILIITPSIICFTGGFCRQRAKASSTLVLCFSCFFMSHLSRNFATRRGKSPTDLSPIDVPQSLPKGGTKTSQ